MSENVKTNPLENKAETTHNTQTQSAEEAKESKGSPIETRNLKRGAGGRFQSTKIPEAIQKYNEEQKKPDTHTTTATKKLQQWLSEAEAPLPENASRDEVSDFALLQIVKMGQHNEKMATAAVQAAKELRNRSRGEAAKSELDREAYTAKNENLVKVVVIPTPELMNPEPLKKKPTPKQPSWLNAEFTTDPPALPFGEEQDKQ